MQKEQKSGFGVVGIIIIIAAVAVLGGGYWYWQAGTEVPLPPSSDQNPVVAKDDFTGWKTYRNEKYGFEVKYPNTLQSVSFPNAPSPEYFFELATPEDDIKLHMQVFDGPFRATGEMITIDNRRAVKFTPREPYQTAYAVELDKNAVLEIRYYTKDISYQILFDNILSTFKFIN